MRRNGHSSISSCQPLLKGAGFLQIDGGTIKDQSNLASDSNNMIHIILHFVVPALIAFLFYRNIFFKAWLIMIATMVVDIDHLLAVPIYDPNRCSIGFHPLHSYTAIGIYFLLLFIPKVRLIALGLLIHMALDYIDCYA